MLQGPPIRSTKRREDRHRPRLVLVLGDTATAAKLITGKQIKNSSLTGADIKNGSVGPVDLSAAAKSATKGIAGPAGPTGAPGAKGDANAPGAKGDTGAPGGKERHRRQRRQRFRGRAGRLPRPVGRPLDGRLRDPVRLR